MTLTESPGRPSSTVQQRLPVNPRRHKVAPEQRKRVATACNSCNVRRIKCSGERPCRQCRLGSRECQYPVAVEKVSVSRTDLDDLRHRIRTLETCLRDAVPDPARRLEMLRRVEPAGPMNAGQQQAVPASARGVPGSGSGGAWADDPLVTGGRESGTPGTNTGGGSMTGVVSASSSPAEEQDEYSGGGRMYDTGDGFARYHGDVVGLAFLDTLREFMNRIFPLAYPSPNPAQSQLRPYSNPISSTSTPPSILHPEPPRTQRHDTMAFPLPPSYRFFDPSSAPAPEALVEPLWLPSRGEMAALLSDLRYTMQDGHGMYPSGGIFWWGDLSSVPALTTPPSATRASVSPTGDIPSVSENVTNKDSHRHLAFYHAAFAVAYCARTDPMKASLAVRDLAEASYMRAKMLLANPLDIARYTISDVAVLALMGFYLLETGRRDAAYMCVGVAVHVAVMHGAHRGWVDERGKRVFWTLYILDRWMSCLMGRPPAVLHDAVRLPLPQDAPSMPPAAGLRAHVQLGRISEYIVCTTYKVAPHPSHPDSGLRSGPFTGVRHIDEAMHRLSRWHSELPPELRLRGPLGQELSDDPACCLLHMTSNQLIVLAIRPLYFATIKKRFAALLLPQHRRWSIESHPYRSHIHACSDAARQSLRLARHIQTNILPNLPLSPAFGSPFPTADLGMGMGPGFGLSGSSPQGPKSNLHIGQLATHYVFHAAVILLLQSIVCPNIPIEDMENLRWAVDLVSPTLAVPGANPVRASPSSTSSGQRTTGSTSRDCANILRELQSLVDRLRSLEYDTLFHGVMSGSMTHGVTSPPMKSTATNTSVGTSPRNESISPDFDMNPDLSPYATQNQASLPTKTPLMRPPLQDTIYDIQGAPFSPGILNILNGDGNGVGVGGEGLYREFVSWLDFEDWDLCAGYAV